MIRHTHIIAVQTRIGSNCNYR